MNGSHVAFALAGLCVLLGAFLFVTTGAWSRLALAIVGAALATGLGLYLRKDRLRPPFEARTGN